MAPGNLNEGIGVETCTTCGANWANGQFTPKCPECGGGALEIACPRCGGRCGEKWRRAVIDSNDAKVGHWIGACKASSPGLRADDVIEEKPR